jgi:hypothetical protein
MKLNGVLAERTANQLGAEPIPDQHQAMPQLNQVFGDHTFFIASDGLCIVEPGEPNDAGLPTGEVVRVAGWSDETRGALVPQPPEATGIVIVFADGKPNGAA